MAARPSRPSVEAEGTNLPQNELRIVAHSARCTALILNRSFEKTRERSMGRLSFLACVDPLVTGGERTRAA